jgi:O-antigen ligase
MLADLKQARYPVELGLLLAFCLALPLVEFWKNAALLAYAIAWLVNRGRARDFGGPWRTSDSLVALWLGAAYLAAAFAGLDGRALAKTGDVAASALLFWMVARAGYTEREGRWLLGALAASTVAGLAIGYLRLWTGWGKSGQLQLYSVGHVNHTAIYLAIMLGVCASWLCASWRAWPLDRRAIALFVTALVFASLAVTASRAAIGMGYLFILVLAVMWWPRWRLPLIASVVAVAVAVSLLAVYSSDIARKQALSASAGDFFLNRDGIWRLGLEGWRRYPWFGVGKDNYGRITPEQVRVWHAEARENFDPSGYFVSSHGHSLYVTTLVERGVVGAASLAAILGAALVALLRFRPRRDDGDFIWLAWGSAASAWCVTAGVGLVNTTLHHEHGLLAALLLALWLSTLRPRPAS